MTDNDETTCFTLPVQSCGTCFNDYRIKFPFNLSPTVFGGNVRVGIKATDIPRKRIEVFSVISRKTNSILYEKCSVTVGDANWCEATCKDVIIGINKLMIQLLNFNDFESRSESCEVTFI